MYVCINIKSELQKEAVSLDPGPMHKVPEVKALNKQELLVSLTFQHLALPLPCRPQSGD